MLHYAPYTEARIQLAELHELLLDMSTNPDLSKPNDKIYEIAALFCEIYSRAAGDPETQYCVVPDDQ